MQRRKKNSFTTTPALASVKSDRVHVRRQTHAVEACCEGARLVPCSTKQHRQNERGVRPVRFPPQARAEDCCKAQQSMGCHVYHRLRAGQTRSNFQRWVHGGVLILKPYKITTRQSQLGLALSVLLAIVISCVYYPSRHWWHLERLGYTEDDASDYSPFVPRHQGV